MLSDITTNSNNKLDKLVFKKVNNEYCIMPNVSEYETGTPRKSTRIKKRVSYAEYLLSPTKSTPLRRGRSQSVDINVQTPRRSSRSKGQIPVSEESYLPKTPNKHDDNTDVPTTPNSLKKLVVSLGNMKVNELTPKRVSRRSLLLSDDIYYTPPITTTTKRRGQDCSDEENVNVSPRKRKTLQNTPRNKAKLIRDGVITPSLQNRTKKITNDNTPLMKARSQLHVSYVPKALPCREKEYNDIHNFLEGKLVDGCGGCMYISGVPGTGKTATVTYAIDNLLKFNNYIPKFDFVSLNGMRLTEPRQAYVEIIKQLTGKTVSWEQAQSLLEERFTKSKKDRPCVMLIDELDILCTKRQDVVYNLLDWPTKAKTQLIVITIANTMDLPERLLMSRVTSRLGLTRLTFQAYTYKQLQEIVTKRLSGTDSFNSDAVQFVARKVASVSGDARRALDICRRAAEIAELQGNVNLVSIAHVNEALNAMLTQPKVKAIKRCSKLEQLILQAIVAEVERTGVEETTFADISKMLVSISALNGFKMASCTNSLGAVARLSASRLILTDRKCGDIYQRIILNVSTDDVFYALRKE